MQRPYTDQICRLKQHQNQQEPQPGETLYSPESIAEVLDRDPSLRPAFDRLLEDQQTEGGSPDPRRTPSSGH